MKLANIVLFLFITIFIISCGDDENPNDENSIQLGDGNNFVFSNFKWIVKETKNIADSRYFCLTKKENVSIDKDGNLRLKLTKTGDTWYGGEITIDSSLGYGEYSFEARIESDGLDANATLAFTIINITDNEYEGMTQTGVRFSKYSEADAPNELEYFLYATDKKFAEVQTPDNPFLLSRVKSTHKIGVYSNYLYYSSKVGSSFYEFKASDKGSNITDLPDALTFSAATENLKVIISLCLPDANETLSGKDVEVIISNFKYWSATDNLTKSDVK